MNKEMSESADNVMQGFPMTTSWPHDVSNFVLTCTPRRFRCSIQMSAGLLAPKSPAHIGTFRGLTSLSHTIGETCNKHHYGAFAHHRTRLCSHVCVRHACIVIAIIFHRQRR